jgi:hypothetical protein
MAGLFPPSDAQLGLGITGAPGSVTQASGLGGLGPSPAEAAAGVAMPPLPPLPPLPAPPAPATPRPFIGFSPGENKLYAGGRAFSPEDVQSALQANQGLGGSTQRPTNAPADLQQLSPQAYGAYLEGLRERRGFLGNVALGARGAAEGLIGGVGRGLEIAGATDTGPAIAKFAERTFGQSEFEQQRSALIQQSNSLWSNILDAAYQGLPSVAVSGLAALGGTLVGGPAGTAAGLSLGTARTLGSFSGIFATTFPQELNSLYQSAERNGFDTRAPDTQREMVAAALGSTVIQSLSEAAIARGFSPALKALVDEKSRGAFARAAAGAAKGGLGEAGAEALAEVIQSVTFDPKVRAMLNASDLKALAPYIVDQYGYDVAVAAGAGAVLGGAFGGLGGIASGRGGEISTKPGDPTDLTKTAGGTPPPPPPPLGLPAPPPLLALPPPPIRQPAPVGTQYELMGMTEMPIQRAPITVPPPPVTPPLEAPAGQQLDLFTPPAPPLALPRPMAPSTTVSARGEVTEQQTPIIYQGAPAGTQYGMLGVLGAPLQPAPTPPVAPQSVGQLEMFPGMAPSVAPDAGQMQLPFGGQPASMPGAPYTRQGSLFARRQAPSGGQFVSLEQAQQALQERAATAQRQTEFEQAQAQAADQRAAQVAESAPAPEQAAPTLPVSGSAPAQEAISLFNAQPSEVRDTIVSRAGGVDRLFNFIQDTPAEAARAIEAIANEIPQATQLPGNDLPDTRRGGTNATQVRPQQQGGQPERVGADGGVQVEGQNRGQQTLKRGRGAEAGGGNRPAEGRPQQAAVAPTQGTLDLQQPEPAAPRAAGLKRGAAKPAKPAAAKPAAPAAPAAAKPAAPAPAAPEPAPAAPEPAKGEALKAGVLPERPSDVALSEVSGTFTVERFRGKPQKVEVKAGEASKLLNEVKADLDKLEKLAACLRKG